MLRRFLLALVLVAAPALARAEELGPTSGEKLLEEAVKVTQRNWWDRANRDKIDWKGLVERYRDRAKKAATPVEAHHVVNDAFGELKTSHLSLVEGSVYDREIASEFASKPTLRAAFELTVVQQSYFVCSLIEGSPAARAGLRVGDEVIQINGARTADCPLLQDSGRDPGMDLPMGYVLDVKTPEPLELVVRHSKGGKSETVAFTPNEICLLEGTKSSVRIIEEGGKRLGVIHLWHFMSSDMSGQLKKALKGPLADCDGLILDVRGRGGRSNVIWEVTNNFTGKNPTWTKPVVVLQDHGTRSAKEIFAWSWKKNNLGKIVGERTLGAVIGCQFKKLFDGSVLEYPAQDVRPMTKGEPLEGVGVEPHVKVEVGDLRWRNGHDPILERGKQVLVEEMKTWKSRGRWL
ncbi:MAG: S41 family peptidase [Planctomycetota bacterium]